MHLRLATAADVEPVAELFQAIFDHYFGEPTPWDETRAHVAGEVLAPGGCEVLLAEDGDGRPLGLATFAVLYAAPGLTGQLYLKDLFVMTGARGRGVGEALMRRLARLARERGCSRLDWTAETDNPAALAFYACMGIRPVTEKVYFRIDGATLDAFAQEAD